MIKNNCIGTVKILTGNADNKSFSTSIANIRATVIPASQETLALYPELPVGQTYTIIINDNALTMNLQPESEFIITDAQDSAFAVNDTFQLRGQARKDKIMGNTIFSFVAVKISN